MMAYCSASDVSALCQQILGSSSAFSTSTSPTLVEVNVWLTSGCAVLETRLSGKGYTTPVASTVGVYGWLRDLNAYYGAWHAELSRTNIILEAGQRTRAQVFQRSFWEGLDQLLQFDLTMAGIERSSVGKIYAGGISKATKDDYEADTDRVRPRFRRAQFGFPGTVRPDSYTSGSEVD